eukprot:6479349-Amphidinium_carterae.1
MTVATQIVTSSWLVLPRNCVGAKSCRLMFLSSARKLSQSLRGFLLATPGGAWMRLRSMSKIALTRDDGFRLSSVV